MTKCVVHISLIRDDRCGDRKQQGNSNNEGLFFHCPICVTIRQIGVYNLLNRRRSRRPLSSGGMSDDSTQLILGDAAIDATTEGKRGRRRKRSRRTDERVLTHCENCGAPLSGPYCSACGQHAIDYHRSLWRVLIDAADSFLNWDTKFLSTIGVLLIRPWQLTNDFNAGRRARYVHPLRLYLLASIAFFLIARLVNFNTDGVIQLDAEDRTEIAGVLGKLTGPDSALTPEQQATIES